MGNFKQFKRRSLDSVPLLSPRQLEQNHFDIVLCDETMPYVRGSEVAEWMRKREATRYIPFVLISAEQNSQFFGELMTGGKINSYLAKPFSVQAITNLMSIYLKSSPVA